MKNKLLILLFLLSGYLALGQSTITGKVIDQSTGEGLPGVNIFKVGTSEGAVTDLEGNYKIQTDGEDVLRFSFIGYKPKEIQVNGRSVIDVALEEDVTSLSEVVVVGYGSQKKSVASAAISSADVEAMEKISVPSVGRSLQGLVNGVSVSGVSGQPNSTATILIRGVGTNGDNQPLVVIDGFQTGIGTLNALSPNDVESIQILKDAASTAIYGTKGANGVIVVKTKSGKNGALEFNYNGSYFMQSAWKTPEMLNANQYVDIINEKYRNGGSALPQGFPEEGSTPMFDTDWMNTIFSPSKLQNHNISLSKGNEDGSFFASITYTDQDGIVAPEKSYFDRITARFNSTNKINEFLNFGQNVSIVGSKSSSIPENNEFGTPIGDAIAYDPITPVYDDNAQFGFAQSPYVQKEYINPLSRIFINNGRQESFSVFGNAYLEAKPLDWLKVRTDIAINQYTNKRNNYSPAYELTPAFQNLSSDVLQENEGGFQWQWENYFTINQKFGKNSFEFVGGTTAIKGTYYYVNASGQDLPEEALTDENLRYIALTPDSSRRSYNIEAPATLNLSYFARVLYDYDEKYLATASIRRDGSSAFGPENRIGYFPSASLGWVASKEDFFDFDLVDFLKVRVSYGLNGNDRIDPFQFAGTISLNNTYQFGTADNQTIYYGAAPTQVANPFVRWERSEQLDIGLESKLLDNRIGFEIDYYRKVTDGLLITDESTPVFAGNNPAIANIGEIVNSGIEFKIDYYQDIGDFSFGATLNGSTLNNVVTSVDGKGGFLNGYNWPIRNTFITRMEADQPLFYFRGYESDGIFSDQSAVFSHINDEGDLLQPNAKPGDLRFVDTNEDGVINVDDYTNIGKPWADFIFGLNLTAKYKGFDMNMLIAGQTGSQIYRTFERQDVPNNNYTTEWLDRWSETNPNGSYPRVATGALGSPDANNNSPSSFYIEDADFVRIKNLQIGYTLPKALLEAASIKRLRIYLSFDNLLTITGYSGFDPEIGVTNYNITTANIDRGYYPQTRNIGGGLQLTF